MMDGTGNIGSQEEESAKVTLMPGDIVFTSKPFLAVLNRDLKFKRCDYCMETFPPREDKSRPRPLTCQECSACLFCDTDCRDAAAGDHTDECQYLRQRGKSIISDPGRFMMKLLLKLSRSNANNNNSSSDSHLSEEVQYNGVYVKRSFSQLLDHCEHVKQDRVRMKKIKLVYAELKKYGLVELPENFQDFVKISAKVLINSFNCVNERNEQIGLGLYLGASLLDHSCAPNAAFSFSKGRVVIRALENIDLYPPFSKNKVAETVSISYIDLVDTRDNRVQRLKRMYNFECKCKRCSNPEFDKVMFCLRCQTTSCQGKPVFVGISANSDASKLKPETCRNCGKAPLAKLLRDYAEVCDLVQGYLVPPAAPPTPEEAKAKAERRRRRKRWPSNGFPDSEDEGNNGKANSSSDSEDDEEEVRVKSDSNGKAEEEKPRSAGECLSLMSGLFHPDHFLYTKAAKLAFEENLSSKNYEEARNYAVLCLNSYRKYKHHVWPAYGALLLKLGRMELDHMTPKLPIKVAYSHLTEALEVAAVTHGKEHPLYTEIQELCEKSKFY